MGNTVVSWEFVLTAVHSMELILGVLTDRVAVLDTLTPSQLLSLSFRDRIFTECHMIIVYHQHHITTSTA